MLGMHPARLPCRRVSKACKATNSRRTNEVHYAWHRGASEVQGEIQRAHAVQQPMPQPSPGCITSQIMALRFIAHRMVAH